MWHNAMLRPFSFPVQPDKTRLLNLIFIFGIRLHYCSSCLFIPALPPCPATAYLCCRIKEYKENVNKCVALLGFISHETGKIGHRNRTKYVNFVT